MKKQALLILSGVFFIVLSGCAVHQDKMSTDSMSGETMHHEMKPDETTVKCPACGFEFNIPSDA